jgi:hypothetical protein
LQPRVLFEHTGGFHGFADGVGDVVKFEVQKNFSFHVADNFKYGRPEPGKLLKSYFIDAD